jgi:hypothetical protein
VAQIASQAAVYAKGLKGRQAESVKKQISCNKNIENKKQIANADYVNVSQHTTLYQHTQTGKRMICLAT